MAQFGRSKFMTLTIITRQADKVRWSAGASINKRN